MIFKKTIECFATFFYVGRVPKIPGTAASLLGLLLCLWVSNHTATYIFLFFGITALGFWVSGCMEEILGEKDPSCVVIDEVSGVMIAFFLLPVTPVIFVSTFFIFRFFDILKVFPMRKLEKLGGGVGIMMDDIVAGIYTNCTMQVLIRVIEGIK